MNKINNSLPWQKTAKNLILYAQGFQKATDEFERQVGYLLLDVGVETLFRVFVTQPGTEAKTGFTKRDKIAKGTVDKTNIQKNEISLSAFDELAFHTLVETVKQIAGDKVNKDDLYKVEYFHNIRNKIYHLGDGIVPTKENFDEYLNLAQILLQNLMDVSLDDITQESQSLYKFSHEIDKFQQEMYIFSMMGVKDSFDDLRRNISVAIALQRTKYATRRFKEALEELGREYIDTLDSTPSGSVYEFAEAELIKKFNDLTGTKTSHTKFIREACYDVTYLQLGFLLSVMGDDLDTGLNKYLEHRDYSWESIHKKKQVTQDDINKNNEYYSWVKTMQEKINLFIEEKASNL